MEDTLRVSSNYFKKIRLIRLNPCFNGRYSQSKRFQRKASVCSVLILVLMEDTLREKKVRVEDPKT